MMSARWLAFLAIQAFEQRGAFVSKVLDELYEEHHIDPRERRLATELASEGVRRRLTLDAILRSYVNRPREAIQDEVWFVLRLGVLQLVFLNQIQPHAAVNETVELCGNLRLERARGFVNGVLRSLERELLNDRPGESVLADQTELRFAGATDKIPVAALRYEGLVLREVHLARRVLPDPELDAREFISQAMSLPRWLIDRWADQSEDMNRVYQLALWFTTAGRMSLRVNPLQTTRNRVLEVLAAADVEARLGLLPEAIDLQGMTAVRNLPGFQEGWFSVQDHSAMAAVELLAPQSGEQILDLCAAPGGKSCHLAERLAGTGRIVACDISSDRLKSVTENINRLKLTNIETCLIDLAGMGMPSGVFDAVLLDVPCSNTGVLGKRPEARWRISPSTFETIAPQQRELLTRAIALVRSGGRIVYSTCSIDRAENELVVQQVLNLHPHVRIERECRHWPGIPADGGYQALLYCP